MSASPSLLAHPVIRTLRAAGCVFAEDEALLLIAAASGPTELATMLERRVVGVPLEHVLGWAEFRGLRVGVDPGVFVPRRRTEYLVECAAEHRPPPAVVVDLCCGSGAVGVALLAAIGAVELHAVDIDPLAVRCARRNLAARGTVHLGDLYEPLPPALRGRVDVLVANAPYVPTDAIGLLPPEAREHESLTALDGGPDGLDVQRRVAAAAPQWLTPGGRLLIETSADQALRTAGVVAQAGLLPQVTYCDELGATVVTGTRRG